MCSPESYRLVLPDTVLISAFVHIAVKNNLQISSLHIYFSVFPLFFHNIIAWAHAELYDKNWHLSNSFEETPISWTSIFLLKGSVWAGLLPVQIKYMYYKLICKPRCLSGANIFRVILIQLQTNGEVFHWC